MCGVIKTAMARLICSKLTNNFLLNTITVYISLQIQPPLNARERPKRPGAMTGGCIRRLLLYLLL